MFAAGALPLSGIGTAMSIYVQPYFAQDLGVGLIPIAVALFWIRIIDMGVDPVLAIVMDRTRTPIGRYRAWMLAGAPILMLGVWQLFMAPKGIGIAYLIVWYLVYALGGRSLARHLDNPALKKWFNRLTGTMFIGFGLLLLRSKHA